MTETPEPQPIPEGVQDNRRKRAMRWIAIGSFLYMVAQGTAVTAFVLLSSERTAIASVIQGLTPLLIATNAMFISVVLGFMGASTTERYLTGRPG
jgi:flagellar basal body-associated protein FliL